MLNERYYGVEYQANRYCDHDTAPENRKVLSPSNSASSSPLRSPKGTEDYGQRMTVSDLENHESDATSSTSEEETRVVDEHVTVTTKVETQVLEDVHAEQDAPLESIVESTTTTTTSEVVEVVELTEDDDAETFVTVGEVAEEEERVVEQRTVTTSIVEEADSETEDGIGDEDVEVETEVTTTTVTTTTTTTVILESDDEAASSSAQPQTSEHNVQTLEYSERLSITAPPESPEFGSEIASHKDNEKAATDKNQSSWKKLLVGMSILPLLALTWAAACWLSPSSKLATVSRSFMESAAERWNGFLSDFKALLSGFLSKIGNPEAQASKFFGQCTTWWNQTSVGSAVKTALSKSNEKLQHYTGVLHDEVRAAFAFTTDTCASMWDRVFPTQKDTSLVESTRENLLDPFEADQQMLNDKLKQLLLKQEAWALEELKRMKKRRVAHASVTDSILSDTRAMVLESLQEAKLVAGHHIEAYTQTISDELMKSIKRELDEYYQSVCEAQLEVEHGKQDLVATTQHELEALEQLKAEKEHELDAELDQDTSKVVSTKERLIQELAEIAAIEKENVETEYQRAVDTVSHLVEAEDDRLEAEMENVEKEVIEIANQEEEWIRKEDSKLLDELKMLAKLETMRIEAEREQALFEVAQVAEKEEERIRKEREQAEALTRKLEAEEQRLLAERQRAEAEIAEAARLDALRLEEERKRAEDEILEALKQEQGRIHEQVLKTEEELALIKHQEEKLAQVEKAKAEVAIAEAVFAEEERLQRERDILAAQLALEANLEQEWLREERLLAEQALEQALEEEECKLCAQEKESEEVLDQAGEEIENTLTVGGHAADTDTDTDTGVSGGNTIEIVSVPEVIPLLLPEQEQVMIIAEQSNYSTVDSILPSNRSAVGSMLRFPLSIPKMELYPVGLLSATFAVLGLITAYFLCGRYQQLLARRRQKAHVFRARRKRWQRRVESEDLEFAEEVVLLSSGSSSELNGREPEPEAIGYFSDMYTVSEVATEDLSQASSVEEMDEAVLLTTTTTRTTTTTSQIFTSTYADEVEEDGGEEEEEATVTKRLVVQQRRVVVETTGADAEDEDEDEDDETLVPQNQFETPTRRSRRASTRRAISPTS